MASFVLSFFPLDVLDGIWDLIESVSEGFLTYSYRPQVINEEQHVALFPDFLIKELRFKNAEQTQIGYGLQNIVIPTSIQCCCNVIALGADLVCNISNKIVLNKSGKPRVTTLMFSLLPTVTCPLLFCFVIENKKNQGKTVFFYLKLIFYLFLFCFDVSAFV